MLTCNLKEIRCLWLVLVQFCHIAFQVFLMLRSFFLHTSNLLITQEFEGFIPAIQSAGLAAMSKVTDQVSDMGKTLTNQANTVISAAEETLGSIGSVISNSGCCFTRKTLWLSNMLHRTSKSTVQLGNAKARNPNSRKQK